MASLSNCIPFVAWKTSKKEFFLVSIFPYSDWIRTRKNSIFGKSPYSVGIRENTDQKKLRIWTLFMPWFTDITNLHSFSNKHLLFSGVYRNSRWGLSSNINEVIRALLKSLFFLRKDFARTKNTESTKSTKSTKRHKDTQAKTQSANEQISDYFPLRYFLRAFFIFVRL